MDIKLINILNLCVPCACHCSYCLLSYERKLEGVDFYRGLNYAKRFSSWLKDNHPNISFSYYFGYSMDTPYLISNYDDLKELNSPITKFLQFNGIKIMKYEILKKLILEYKNKGIELTDLTFYGIWKTHDEFAGRIGDYTYLLEILKVCNEIKLDVEVDISLTKRNIDEMDELISILESYTNRIFIFVPHSNGKGINILNNKISKDDYEMLSNNVKRYFNRAN